MPSTLFRVEDFLVTPGTPVDLAALPTHLHLDYGERKLARLLQRRVERFADLQRRLFAESRHALLLIFHGMDAAGKDSTIRHVTAGVNSQGFRVADFSRPTTTELGHTWLHRHWLALPERGRIGIFNRSHYEEVVTVRVQPELLAARKLSPEDADDTFWQQRLDDIVAFESHLARNGIRVVKFFLNVSKEEQRQRIVKRLHDPKRNWKYDPSDLAARRRWDDYRGAFETGVAGDEHGGSALVRGAGRPQADDPRRRRVDHRTDLEAHRPAFPEPARQAVGGHRSRPAGPRQSLSSRRGSAITSLEEESNAHRHHPAQHGRAIDASDLGAVRRPRRIRWPGVGVGRRSHRHSAGGRRGFRRSLRGSAHRLGLARRRHAPHPPWRGCSRPALSPCPAHGQADRIPSGTLRRTVDRRRRHRLDGRRVPRPRRTAFPARRDCRRRAGLAETAASRTTKLRTTASGSCSSRVPPSRRC